MFLALAAAASDVAPNVTVKTSSTGPWLAFVGAVIVAVVAAVTAQARLRRQLAHDRDLKNREALRDALETTVNRCIAIYRDTIAFGRKAQSPTWGDDATEELVKRMKDHPADMLGAVLIIAIRRADESLSDPLIRFLDATNNAHDRAGEYADAVDPAKSKTEFARATEAMAEALSDFAKAGNALVNLDPQEAARWPDIKALRAKSEPKT